MRFCKDMKDVLQAFEGSFLQLAEAQHYLEANGGSMEQFPGYIIRIFNNHHQMSLQQQ